MGWKLELNLRANRREVPPGMIPEAWWEKFHELSLREDILEVPFWHPALEFLTPEELRRVKAKALVWREVTGDWPGEVAWWMELRKARRRGDLPHMSETTPVTINESDALVCGYCHARWSANHDGSPRPERCKLCDRVFDLNTSEVL